MGGSSQTGDMALVAQPSANDIYLDAGFQKDEPLCCGATREEAPALTAQPTELPLFNPSEHYGTSSLGLRRRWS
jgi:hypothetical protein